MNLVVWFVLKGDQDFVLHEHRLHRFETALLVSLHGLRPARPLEVGRPMPQGHMATGLEEHR